MRRVLITLLLSAACLLPAAHSQIRYSAPIDGTAQKLWSNTNSKLSCVLTHDIPGFGNAEFKTYAGRILKSSMMLHPRLGINDKSVMRFISTKPEWQSGGREILLGKIDLFSGFDPYTGETLAWKVLGALSHGQQILMPYTDSKIAEGQNIIPMISPLGFDKAYQSYLTCQQQLLRVNFSDVQMLPLAFKFREKELTNKSKQQIAQQIEYIKEDKSINGVIIRAYSYDMQTKTENIRMAEDRGEVLRQMYIDAGLNADTVSVVKFNALSLPKDRENPTPNYTVTARNALVSLERDNSLVDKDLDTKVEDVGANTGEY